MQTASRWKDFFSEFGSLWRKRSEEQQTNAAPSAYADFFAEFTSLYAPYRAQGRAVNFVQLAGIGSDELRNSAVLAWLLDCSGSHGQGAAFLRCFVSCLAEYAFTVDVADNYRTVVESSYDEETESLNGRRRSRVDIELDGPDFLLFIEVKTKSGESGDQLGRYLSLGQARSGKRPWALAFVTPEGRLPADSALPGRVACVSWAALGKALTRHTATMPPDSHGTVIIRQFCEHITSL